MRRAHFVAPSLALVLLASGCGDGGPGSHGPIPHPACSPAAAPVSMTGDIFIFGPTGGPWNGGAITALDAPGGGATLVDSGFTIGGMTPCAEQVLFLDHPDVLPVQTGILFVPEAGLEQVSFQTVTWDFYDMFVSLLGVTIDPDLCLIASTVTRRGASLYTADANHGMAGATVTIDPPVAASSGPIYFHWYSDAAVLPDPYITETTIDGGVLFVNVAPGTYRLDGHKDGVSFRPAWVWCRPGVFINASPPHGIQEE